MKIELQKKEFEEHLVQSTIDVESKKDREWLERIEKIKQSLREHSDIRARKLSNVYSELDSHCCGWGRIHRTMDRRQK
jgi:hypothetical protein